MSRRGVLAAVVGALALLATVVAPHWLSPGDPFLVAVVTLPIALLCGIIALRSGGHAVLVGTGVSGPDTGGLPALWQRFTAVAVLPTAVALFAVSIWWPYAYLLVVALGLAALVARRPKTLRACLVYGFASAVLVTALLGITAIAACAVSCE